jgi:DNA adenine methylase
MIRHVRYPGGKGTCYRRLINLMPPHRVYIESHLGGGACMRYKKPAEINIGIDADARVIESWRAERPNVCRLVHTDAVTYLARYPFIGNELVYCDPPYLPSVRRRARVYRCDYTDEGHRELLEGLKTLPCMVMISGYDNSLYAQHLAGWRHIKFKAMTHAGPAIESVWMNYQAPADLHDPSFIGDTFRQRQNIQRKHQRLFRRFELMEGSQRRHLLSALQRRFGAEGAAS